MNGKEVSRSLAAWSVLLFVLSLLCWLGLTAFESLLVNTSLVAERAITLVLLVLPPAIGIGLGFMSLLRKEGKAWLATLGIVLNIVFALFNLTIVLFAG
jgi:hypothetical protein